jgi:hypothetical protein
MKLSPRSLQLACGVALVTVVLGCGEQGSHVFSGAGGSGGAAGSIGVGGATGGATGGGEASTGGAEPAGQGGSGGGGYRGPNTVVTNSDSTCNWLSWSADEGEENHLAAARLTPPSYPFVIVFVRYTLLGYLEQCDPGLAHGVDVFVGSDVAPPATPTVIQHIDVAMTNNDEQQRVMLHELSTPLTLNEGEHIFVAVRMTGTNPQPLLCVQSCSGPAYQQDRNYWSNAVAPPYPWTMLGRFTGRNFAFEAIGHPP